MALNSDRYTRREAMKLAGLLGFGAGLPEQVEGRTAQVNRVSSSVPGIPSWPTEIRRLAPDVSAYPQAGGPGIDDASLSNAGVSAGPEGLLAIDTLGPPIHAKAFKSAAEMATARKFNRVINTHHH